ncbi:MAG: class I tRNA ligase family protein, partial [Actinobacteria bacterium]|nr:class I tRNA ligase family protein [Actinomycetota bacterium]
TINEFLSAPVIYVKNELRDEYEALKEGLPLHTFREAEKGKASFELEFETIDLRDKARDILSKQGIRLRTGKALVPFRLTGNITWGVPAPVLEGEEGLTVWCWPESLWAPISFSAACLAGQGHRAEEWRDWWCSDEAEVYQFIGQDNIYFYGVAQPAIWSAMQTGHEPRVQAGTGELKQTTLVANHHVLFLNKKASSSSEVKPPMAAELLAFYTPEQLRAHFLALGLGLKSVSFQPKPLDPGANPKGGDPVLKEGALLTNVFNRFARSCFYSAQRANGVVVANAKTGEEANGAQSYMPLGQIDPELIKAAEETILEYERLMYTFELHSIMALMDRYIRTANTYWNEHKDDEDQEALLRNAFYLLRVCAVLMHPIVPIGTEMIREYLGFGEDFWEWRHIFSGNEEFCSDEENDLGRHAVKTLLPRIDFFEKHPSQFD